MPSYTVDKNGHKKRRHGTTPPGGTYPKTTRKTTPEQPPVNDAEKPVTDENTGDNDARR